MDNWFHCEAQNLSVNLTLVTEIEWEQKPGTTRVYYGQNTASYGNGNGLVYAYTDINDETDRIALRRKVLGTFKRHDEWKPSQKPNTEE